MKQLKNPITLKIYTRKPNKWILIDTETKQRYQGRNSKIKFKQWKKIN
jgi:hypothetical protein|tara:strand:+ start:3108 stop:3251 length:144 start_codon:yes stop_codon:yes gene_type:complete